MRTDPARLRRVTTVDHLPVERSRLDLGHVGDMTPAERAILNSLKPKLLELLDGNGVSIQWMVERTGLGTRHCVCFLREIGARKPGGRVLWRLPRIPTGSFGWRA